MLECVHCGRVRIAYPCFRHVCYQAMADWHAAGGGPDFTAMAAVQCAGIRNLKGR